TAPSPPDPPPLSLHDALPICLCPHAWNHRLHASRRRILGPAAASITSASLVKTWQSTTSAPQFFCCWIGFRLPQLHRPLSCSFPDRKSTRLNSSHLVISYAVF